MTNFDNLKMNYQSFQKSFQKEILAIEKICVDLAKLVFLKHFT